MKRIDRFGAFSGAVYAVVILVSNTMSSGPGPQSAHPTGQDDIAGARWLAGSVTGQVGVSLELLNFAIFMLFVGYLCTRVRAAGWLATAALIGGAVWTAVKLGSFAPMLAGYVLRNDISPESMRVLGEMNGVAFVVDWLAIGVFVACAAAAAMQTATVGRILGWGGVVVGAVSVVTTAVQGVHVSSGNALPFLLCLLWILSVSVRLGAQRTVRPVDVGPPAAARAAV